VAEATLAYWKAFSEIPAKKSGENKALLESLKPAASDSERSRICTTLAGNYRQIALQMSSLPAANVDYELISLAADVSGGLTKRSSSMERMAQLLAARQRINDYYSSPDAFAEALIRGAMGDQYGTAQDLAQAQRNIQRQFTRWQEEESQIQAELDASLAKMAGLRSVLSQRYGVEFPQ